MATTASLPATRVSRIGRQRSYTPFGFAAFLFAAVTSCMIVATLQLTGGHFVFALDDTYINMAMAKNLALHGVWGITRYGFSSSSSTPLYVLLLSAVYRIFGVSTLAPLVLSLSFGLASLFMAVRIVQKFASPLWQFSSVLALCFFSPIFAISILGMEHSLHVFLTLLFLDAISDEACSTMRLVIAAALMTGTRYEGMFVAAGASIALITLKRARQAFVTLVAAVVPVVAYAAFSTQNGGYWIPNSVALKGLKVHGSTLIDTASQLFLRGLGNCVRAPHLALLLAGLLLLSITPRRCNARATVMAAAIVPAGLLQLTAADVGWGFRYEAYLVLAGITVASVLLSGPSLQTSKASKTGVAFLGLAGACLLHQGVQSITRMPHYSHAIYSQQIQMAEFLHEHFPRGTVAANDIGAITFFNDDLHCVDLVGLGDNQVFQAKHAGQFTTAQLNKIVLANGVQVAMVYDDWFGPQPKGLLRGPSLPGTWSKVGRWFRPADNLINLRSTTVSFYAVDQRSSDDLRKAFNDFSPNGSIVVTPGLTTPPANRVDVN